MHSAGTVTVAHLYPGDEVNIVNADMSVGAGTLLRDTKPGQRIYAHGKIYDVRAGKNDGIIELVANGIVAAQVAETYIRQALELVDLTVASADGAERVISGTPEHPFYVPALKEYVGMGQLTPGTVLQTTDGGVATVKSSSHRQGQFDVYNFQVPGAHNYYVAAPGGGGGFWVLVHNNCGRFTPDQEALVDVAKQAEARSGASTEDASAPACRETWSAGAPP